MTDANEAQFRNFAGIQTDASEVQYITNQLVFALQAIFKQPSRNALIGDLLERTTGEGQFREPGFNSVVR